MDLPRMLEAFIRGTWRDSSVTVLEENVRRIMWG